MAGGARRGAHNPRSGNLLWTIKRYCQAPQGKGTERATGAALREGEVAGRWAVQAGLPGHRVGWRTWVGGGCYLEVVDPWNGGVEQGRGRRAWEP